MELIDTHCHLDEDTFTLELDEIVQRAIDAGVTAMLTIGTTADSSRRAVELAAKYPQVYAVVGIQPNYTAEAKPDDWGSIEKLASEPKVVGVGETGLDRYWDYAPMEIQRDYFDRHLDLARRRDLPFVVHCREAEADIVDQLRQAAQQGPLRGVMHSFTGSSETAQACLDLGMFLSFAGMLTYKRNDALRRVTATVPLERILIETDAPYLAPLPMRGKRNEPSHVRFTAKCVADVRGLTLDEVAAATTENARELFRF